MNWRNKTLKELLNPDPDNLVEEWGCQADIYYEMGLELLEEEERLKLLKARLADYEADMDEKIRKSPGDYGLETTTEPSIKAAIKRQSQIKHANRRVLSSMSKVKKLEHILNSVGSVRSKALENLVKLVLNEFHSNKPPKGGSEDFRKKQRKMELIREQQKANARKRRIQDGESD